MTRVPLDGLSKAQVPRALLVAVFAAFVLLVMRITAVESPVMASDEYAYFMTAKYDAVKQDVYRYDPAMQAVDNQVYPLLYDAWQTISPERTALVGRISNALLYVLSAFLLFVLFQRVFDRKTATLSALLYLFFPFSFYATTLLPEVEFQFCIYVSVLLVMWTTIVRTPLAVLLPSLASAIAYFVKPHAAALIVAVGAFYAMAGVFAPLAGAGGLWRRLVEGFGRATLYLVVVIVAIYLGRRLSADAQNGGTTLVANFYGTYLSRLSSPTYLLENIWSMLDYVAGHVWALSMMFAPGILAIGATWKRGLLGLRNGVLTPDGGTAQDRERVLLALLLGMLCAAFLLMIAAFTNSASQVSEFEKYRLHGRYLEPLLPLLLGFSVWAVGQSRRSMVIGLVSLSALILFAFYLRFQYHLYPWDYPDVFVFFTSKMKYWAMAGTNDWLIWLVLLFGVVFAASCALHRFQLPAYVTFLVMLMLGSHIQMSNWLRLHSETNRGAIKAGEALRDYLGRAEPGSGLVLVSDRYGRSSYFLMEFSSLQRIQSIAPGASFVGPLPAGVQWIIAPKDVTVGIAGLHRIDFDEQVLYMHDETVRDAGANPQTQAERPPPAANPRVYEFAAANLDGALSGFHPREPWGRWSSARTATLMLSMPVQGRVRVILSGWVAPTHPDGKVKVRIGNREQVVMMTSRSGEYTIYFDIASQAHSIEFDTALAQVEGDGRPLGVAIGHLQLDAQK